MDKPECTLQQTETFVQEVKAAAPATDVVAPRHFQTLVLDPEGRMRALN